MQRVNIKQVVNGSVAPILTHEAEHIVSTVSREQGDEVANLTFTGAAADADGWRLIGATYTRLVSLTIEERP